MDPRDGASIEAADFGATSPGWRLDELAYAGRENLDRDHVERYDGKEDADAFAEVVMLRGRGLAADSVVVEIGTGTGQFAAAAAPYCARLIAVDVSPVMLKRLEAKIVAQRVTNVELVRSGFLSYEHAGHPVDLVYSRYALHHLPDFWKVVALSRIRRLLRPGGVLRLWDVVFSYEPDVTEESIDRWCATGGDQVEGEWSRAELEEHVRDEHSTFTWLLEPMIERCGFRIEERTYSEDGVDAQYLCRAV